MNSCHAPSGFHTAIAKIPRLGLLSVLVVAFVAFVAGLFLRPHIKDERIERFYARYLKDLPSHKQKPDEDGVFDTVAETNFSTLIRLHSAGEIAVKRRKLADFLWRNAVSPFERQPDSVTTGSMLPFIDLPNVSTVERLEIRMPLGVTSVISILKPKNPRSCLMLYQEGHGVSFLERKRLLNRLVDVGCEVAALSLPLTGADNSRPEIDHPRFGRILLNDPDKLELLETESFSTLQFFLTPPIVALNHALAGRHFNRVGMIGFSGGGWVTTLVAALDPRIQRSYAVAGTVPTNVHAAALNWGSYEQRLARLYDIANYPELYVMAADAPGRQYTQFYNLDDPCCFSGQNWQYWQTPVAARAKQFGGRFSIQTYQSERHTIGKEVAQTIVADIASTSSSATKPEAVPPSR